MAFRATSHEPRTTDYGFRFRSDPVDVAFSTARVRPRAHAHGADLFDRALRADIVRADQKDHRATKRNACDIMSRFISAL